MFALPLIFLLNTFVFIATTKERFKFYINMAIASVTFLISLIFTGTIVNFFDKVVDNSITAVAFNIILLLIASIFSSSNNIAQKILLAFTMHFNFLITTLIIPEMLGSTSISTGGFFPVIMTNGMYILLSLVTVAIFRGPMQSFFRNRITLFSVCYCIGMYFAIANISGFICEVINYDSFAIKFFSGVMLYLAVLFSLRSDYSIAMAKERDFKRLNTEICSSFLYDNINNMLIGTSSYKGIKNSFDYHLKNIYKSASSNGDENVMNYIRTSGCLNVLKPYVKTYNENSYLNAILASKNVVAKANSIDLVANVEISNFDSRIKHLYVMINQMLEIALNSANGCEEAFVSLTSNTYEKNTVYEITYSKIPEVVDKFDIKNYFTKEKIQELGNQTVQILIDNVLADKNEALDVSVSFLKDITQMLDGTLKVVSYENKSTITISLKN